MEASEAFSHWEGLDASDPSGQGSGGLVQFMPYTPPLQREVTAEEQVRASQRYILSTLGMSEDEPSGR